MGRGDMQRYWAPLVVLAGASRKMWHLKVFLFPLLYFKLIDELRIGLPRRSRSFAWQS